MKKRRQLDALVSNGKLPRRKSKSGHELLRSNDSDSSEIEEFSHAFGKKGFRCINCAVCSPCLVLIAFVTLVACIVASAGLIWMHFELKRDLDNLRERLITVESQSKQDDSDVVKLQTDFMTFNKSLATIRIENIKLRKNLTILDDKYKDLIKTSSSLETSLKSIKDLSKLSQIDTLANTLAKYGSKLKEFQSDMTGKMDDAIKRITALESAGQPNEEKKSGGASINPDVFNQLNSLNEDIHHLNTTFLNLFNIHNKNITTKVILLENSTRALVHDVDILKSQSTPGGPVGGNTEVNMTVAEQIRNIVQNMVKNNEIEHVDNGDAVSQLKVQVANLTSLVDMLKLNHSQIQADHSLMTSGDNQTKLIEELQKLTTSSVQDLNETVVKLMEEVDVLFSKFTTNTNKLHHIGETVEALKQYIAHKENETLHAPIPVISVSNTPPISTDKTTNSAQTTVTSAPIAIPSIKTYDDLRNKYDQIASRSTEDPGTGIKLSDFQDFMPSSEIPSEKSMKPYDKDGNGLYNLQELSAALGFNPVESDVPSDLR